jgi:hypothetical protein
MPDLEEAVDGVRRDVTAAIGEWLVPDTSLDRGGFRVLDPFDAALAREADGEALATPDQTTVAVPWAWVGRHVRTARSLDTPHPTDLMGMLATDRVVELRGVTLVRGEGDDLRFSRFIDWTSALAELGIGIFSRPVTDAPPRRPATD